MTVGTIVVIEDEPLVRVEAVELFETAGLSVVGFETGDDAIDYVRQNQRSVIGIFTDIKLPGETDGLVLAALVAEACPQIAVVVTSGQYVERPPELSPLVRYIVNPGTRWMCSTPWSMPSWRPERQAAACLRWVVVQSARHTGQRLDRLTSPRNVRTLQVPDSLFMSTRAIK